MPLADQQRNFPLPFRRWAANGTDLPRGSGARGELPTFFFAEMLRNLHYLFHAVKAVHYRMHNEVILAG